MASINDTVSSLSTAGVVIALVFVLYTFRDPLGDLGSGASDAIGGAAAATQDAADWVGGIQNRPEVGSGGQSSGGPRLATAGAFGNQVREYTSLLFGGSDPGFVERDGEIVAVDEFGNVFEEIDPLTPGDEFGDEQFTGTGF